MYVTCKFDCSPARKMVRTPPPTFLGLATPLQLIRFEIECTYVFEQDCKHSMGIRYLTSNRKKDPFNRYGILSQLVIFT